ncbi:MAG: hypothetical protein ACPGVT_11520 [Maricaulaceae bacterium]
MIIDARTVFKAIRNISPHWDGSASQIHVVNIEISELQNVLNIVASSIHDIKCTPQEIMPHDFSLLEIHRTLNQGETPLIGGMFDEERSLQCWIWLNSDQSLIDIELVYWADEFFPKKMTYEETLVSFTTLYDMTTKLRTLTLGVDCIYSANEVGDPDQERDKLHTYVW